MKYSRSSAAPPPLKLIARSGATVAKPAQLLPRYETSTGPPAVMPTEYGSGTKPAASVACRSSEAACSRASADRCGCSTRPLGRSIGGRRKVKQQIGVAFGSNVGGWGRVDRGRRLGERVGRQRWSRPCGRGCRLVARSARLLRSLRPDGRIDGRVGISHWLGRDRAGAGHVAARGDRDARRSARGDRYRCQQQRPHGWPSRFHRLDDARPPRRTSGVTDARQILSRSYSVTLTDIPDVEAA